MFWKNKEMEDQVRLLRNKVMALQRTISLLEEESSKIKTENERLNKQVVKNQTSCPEQTPVVKGQFKPALSSAEAKNMFYGQFNGDFSLLDEVEVDILNVFLQKIYALKTGQYQPSTRAIASCDEFFNYKKALTRREYWAMLYALLDIKVTSRRFESFNSNLDKSELISMIETLFAYIERQK
ncbi:MAG: regulator of replication initiation timing [Francisellaceae bacterium]|jgi:regulator of replication initiation timing